LTWIVCGQKASDFYFLLHLQKLWVDYDAVPCVGREKCRMENNVSGTRVRDGAQFAQPHISHSEGTGMLGASNETEFCKMFIGLQ
jgi:hypothetical protein